MVANTLFKWLARTFVPDVAKNMQKEGTFNLGEDKSLSADDHPHVIVENRGSDVTIFSYAGMAVLFAGLPVFEFRKLLKANGDDFNLVFFRDVNRSAYTIRPDGQPGGRQFYEEETRRIMRELGSTYNVSIGASAGGALAFNMALECGMDQIVTFSPVLNREVYVDPGRVARHLGNLPKLVTDPQAYMEVNLMTLGALAIRRKIEKKIGTRAWKNVAQQYIDHQGPRPRATIYFGARCSPDRLTATRVGVCPEVKLVPIDTGRHNCAGLLKAQGKMASSILDEIAEGLAQREQRAAAPIPQAQRA